MTKRVSLYLLYPLLLGVFLVSACRSELPESGNQFVLATTAIIGDVVSQVGGELIEVRVLLPPDVDPHSFQPTPQDLVMVEQADLVFTNGFGLEEFLEETIEITASANKVVEVSQGVSPIYFGKSSEEAGIDPHVWMSPLNVLIWVDNIAGALSKIDPGHSAEFHENAREYQAELEDLHIWTLNQLNLVPEEQRLLVSDHETFNYLAQAYGFEVVGALTGFSSLAESSAQDLAKLEDAIMDLDVPVIFVSTTVPLGLAEQVARDTGIQVVQVYTGSLSGADGPAASYLELIQNTIKLMVVALK